ncbi:MAG TPA: hypothetical protein ENJ78_00975 [candidate division WWE3 bacterium]|uniref:Uncharacterized protein n=1 Tax=candidate division WWE3 bacterium TaxID=2053526 RepID=A0A7V5J0F1_UNCKA|nr:hypothetical protein [candidate division WWE3 bacterium]
MDLKNKKINKKTFIPYLLFFSLLLWYQFLYIKPLAYTQGSIVKTLLLLKDIKYVKELIYRFFYIFYYVGIFTFPLTFAYFFTLLVNRTLTKKFLLLLFLFGAFFLSLSLFFWFKERTLMFYLPNMLSYAGFLPQSLNFGIKQTLFVNSPVRIRAFITLVSIFSVSIYFSVLFQRLQENKKLLLKNKMLVLFLITLFMLSPTIIFRDFFDRYLIVIIPFVLLYFSLIAKKPTIIKLPLLYFFVFLFCSWSLIWEYDYLSLNKFAWEYPSKNNFSSKEFRSTFEYNLYPLLDGISSINDPSVLNRETWEPPLSQYKYFLSYSDVIKYCPKIDNLYYTTPLSRGFKGPLKILVICDAKNN